MSKIDRVRWGEAEPRLQRVFDLVYADRGNVPNLYRVMGRRPELMSSFNSHMGKVMGEGQIEVRLKELLAVRVSQVNFCEY